MNAEAVVEDVISMKHAPVHFKRVYLGDVENCDVITIYRWLDMSAQGRYSYQPSSLIICFEEPVDATMFKLTFPGAGDPPTVLYSSDYWDHR